MYSFEIWVQLYFRLQEDSEFLLKPHTQVRKKSKSRFFKKKLKTWKRKGSFILFSAYFCLDLSVLLRSEGVAALMLIWLFVLSRCQQEFRSLFCCSWFMKNVFLSFFNLNYCPGLLKRSTGKFPREGSKTPKYFSQVLDFAVIYCFLFLDVN